MDEPSKDEHRSYHGATAGTESINNILGSEANQLVSNAPELGKARSNNPRAPADRDDEHIPSTKEKIVGHVKVMFGKATGDQDIISSGRALKEGNVERGSK